jgi:predicted Na+-dependent transporter
MVTGAVFPKLLSISNYQTCAISLEAGLRNVSLAMALAILIQDYMGDFHSSMFVTSAMFGLLMYIAGFASIWVCNKTLPVIGENQNTKWHSTRKRKRNNILFAIEGT